MPIVLDRIRAVTEYVRTDVEGFEEEWLHCSHKEQERAIRENEKRMGYAVGPSPMGPFVKATENPIAECTEEITGTGHGCLVRTEQGLKAVYHGRTEATGEPRVGFVAPAGIQDGKLFIDYRHAALLMEEEPS